MKNFCVFCLCILHLALFAQMQPDTSYTAYSTYKKDIKKYPFIKIVAKPESALLGIKKELVYKIIEGRALHLDAFFNPKEKKLPAVILVHGGGWKSGNKEHMRLMAQEIALKGYSCFCVEYRLSGEAQYPEGIFDIKEAIKYVKANATKFNADPKKVAILGCSSGGQMATLIGTTNNNVTFEGKSKIKQNTSVQAIIDMDGVLAFHHPESEESGVAAQWLGGTYNEKPEIWEQASALTHTDKNTPPILFINSDKPRFHGGRDDMIKILDKYGIYHETKTIENSPHSFWFFEPWFDEIVGWSVQFLDKIFKQN